jgi:hypothetical protein
MKPDARKQHKQIDIFVDRDAEALNGPWCWNCELGWKSLEDAPPDFPMHFCSWKCIREWESNAPLQNLLDKRKARRERERASQQRQKS